MGLSPTGINWTTSGLTEIKILVLILIPIIITDRLASNPRYDLLAAHTPDSRLGPGPHPRMPASSRAQLRLHKTAPYVRGDGLPGYPGTARIAQDLPPVDELAQRYGRVERESRAGDGGHFLS